MKKLDLRLLRMIQHSKGQYIAILIIVITGLLIYTAMNSAITNLETSLQEFYDITNFGDVYIEVMHFPRGAMSEFEKIDNVKEIEGRIVFDVPFISHIKDEKVNVRIVTVSQNENMVNKLFMNEGERRIKGREIIIQKQFAEARGIMIGDEIELQINGLRYAFQIKGIASSPEFAYVMEDEQALMPRPDKFGIVFADEELIASLTGMHAIYNSLVLTLNDENKYKETGRILEKKLDKYGLISMIEKEDQLSNAMMFEEINGVKQISGFIPVVFLFAAAAILAAMISRNVKKDRNVIGILKAMGYSNASILRHYTLYALSIGVVGGTIGILAGTLMSGVMTTMYQTFFYIPVLEVKLYPMTIVNAILMTSVFCTVAGVYGARKVLKISPAEAMRPETPKEGHRIMIESFNIIWKKVSFSWKIVFRNIFREKKKFLFISLGAAITVAMSLMTFWISGMMDNMFTEHYGEFMKMDYNIQFSKPINKGALLDLEKILNPDHIEAKMEMPFEVSNGRASKVVNVIGINRSTKTYTFKDFEGYTVNLPETGALISYNLALAIDAQIGDIIKIDNYIPGKDDAYIRVEGIVKQTLGINVYMNIDYMAETLTGKETINGAYVNTKQNITSDLNHLKNIGGVQSTQEMQNSFLEYLDLTVAMVGFMVIFSGLLGFVIIYSMTIMSINERSMEFSSLRVLGFSKREIFSIILKENTVMSALGFVYGLPLGKLMIDGMRTVYVSDVYTFDAPITLKNILYAYGFTIICLTAAQLITYKKIKNLNFIEALKSRTS
ncbi:MAG: ABC transporter permease [Tissierellales bacterium]|nr:ABC transporter permease [Tissierellales bacterium]MBN2827060.1 ABC transporter permease [Tissierellales bacterium]